MGDVKEVPLSLFMTYAVAKKGILFAQTAKDVKAGTIVAEVAPITHVLMLSAGYRVADNGNLSSSKDNAGLLGVKYFYKENVQCQFNYVRNQNSAKRDEVYVTFRTVF